MCILFYSKFRVEIDLSAWLAKTPAESSDFFSLKIRHFWPISSAIANNFTHNHHRDGEPTGTLGKKYGKYVNFYDGSMGEIWEILVFIFSKNKGNMEKYGRNTDKINRFLKKQKRKKPTFLI